MSRQQKLHVETAEQPVCRISGKQGNTCKNPKYGSAPLLLWIFHPVKFRLQPFIAAFLVDPSVYQNQYDKRNKDIAQYPLWLVENIQMPCSLTVKTVEYDSREQHDIDILHNCNSRKGTVRQAMFGRIPWPAQKRQKNDYVKIQDVLLNNVKMIDEAVQNKGNMLRATTSSRV